MSQRTAQNTKTNKSQIQSSIQLPTLYLTFANDVTVPDDVPDDGTEDPTDELPINRTVVFTASDETPVKRFDWYKWEPYDLILSHDPKHVNLDRVDSGVCMFLVDHCPSFDDQLGKITKAEIKDRKMRMTAIVNNEDYGDKYLNRVKLGTAPGNSVGIIINRLEVVKKAKYDINPNTDLKTLLTPALMKAVDWQPVECSAVGIPANPNAGFGSSKANAGFGSSKANAGFGSSKANAGFGSSKANAGFSQGYTEDKSKISADTHSVTVIGDPGYDTNSFSYKSSVQYFTEEIYSLNTTNKLSVVTTQRNGKDMKFSEMSEDELISKCEQFSDEIGTLQKNLAAKDAKVEELQGVIDDEQKRSELLSAYRGLVNNANKLKSQGKLTAVQFEQRFSRTEDQFLADIETQPHLYQQLTGYLEAAEDRKAYVPTELSVDKQPIVKDSASSQSFGSEDDVSWMAELESKKGSLRSY